MIEKNADGKRYFMKKYIAILLAVMMIFVLAGCAEKQTETTPAETTEEAAAETPVESAKTGYKGTVEFANDSYNSLTVDLSSNNYEVTEAAIDTEVASYAEFLGEFKAVTDRPVQNGDYATIDYVGTVDDVEFEGGSANGYELEIGSHSFIDDFEEQLIGAKIGDEVKVEVTFPENYHAADLAGKDAVFMVKINEINEYVVPEMNDETAKELGYADLAAARAEAKATLESTMAEQRATDIENGIWSQVEALATVVVDEQDKQEIIDRTLEEYESYAAQNGTDLETLLSSYFGMTKDMFDAYCDEMAEDEVKYYMIVRALAEKLNITVTDDLFAKTCEELAADMEYETADAFAEEMGMTIEEYYTRFAIEDYILSNEVMEKLQSNATVVG